jgi:hypothetical protein
MKPPQKHFSKFIGRGLTGLVLELVFLLTVTGATPAWAGYAAWAQPPFSTYAKLENYPFSVISQAEVKLAEEEIGRFLTGTAGRDLLDRTAARGLEALRAGKQPTSAQANAIVKNLGSLNKEDKDLALKWLKSPDAVKYSPTDLAKISRRTRGQIGESNIEEVMQVAGRERPELIGLKSVYGTDHTLFAKGIDEVFADATRGRQNVIESKFIGDCCSKATLDTLKTTQTKGQQLSDRWIKASAREMSKNADPELVRVLNELQKTQVKDYDRTLIITRGKGFGGTTALSSPQKVEEALVNSVNDSLKKTSLVDYIIVKDQQTGIIKVVKSPKKT